MDIENHRHATVSQDGRTRDTFDFAEVRFDRFDHDLRLTQNLIHQKTVSTTITFDHDDQAIAWIGNFPRHLKQVPEWPKGQSLASDHNDGPFAHHRFDFNGSGPKRFRHVQQRHDVHIVTDA
jgi:hypothetical protein